MGRGAMGSGRREEDGVTCGELRTTDAVLALDGG